MKNLIKKYWVIGAVLATTASYFVVGELTDRSPAPREFAASPGCYDTATFEGWVLLSYVAEVHAKPGLPTGYTAVIKTPHLLKQTVPTYFKEPDSLILGKLKSPWPDQFSVGQILPDYKITRKFCKAPVAAQSKKKKK